MKIEKIINKRNLFILCVFLLLCLVFYFIPLTGDDWQNYGNGKFGLLNIVRNAYRYYLNWEGRIGSRLIIFLVTYNKWIWNLLASFSSIILVYFSTKLINKQFSKFYSSMLILLIFLLNYDMFVQCFFWIAGHITYTLCTTLFIFYIYYIFSKDSNDSKYSIVEIIILFFLNIFMCTFVENIAVGIVVFNILFLINSIWQRKNKNIYYVLSSVASIAGLLIQILSPGTAVRMSIEMKEFGHLNIIEKIIYNLNNLVNYQYLINPFMVLIMIVALNFLIYKKEKKKLKKILLLLFINIIPILTIIANMNLILPFEFSIFKLISTYLSFVNNSNSILIKVYWLIFTLLYFICIYKYIDDQKYKKKLLILYIVSQSCIFAMLVTPTWSNRVVFTTVILNYIISLIIINYLNISFSKLFRKIVYLLCISYFSILLIFYYNVYCSINYRDKYIIKKYNEGERIINFYTVPNRLLWSQYPYSNSYRNAFSGNLGFKDEVIYIETPFVYRYNIWWICG